MKKVLAIAFLTLSISGCAFSEDPCVDIVAASEQIEQCAQLHRQIINAKDRPLVRTELERRYQLDCVESRYYRDEHGAQACKNKDAIEKASEDFKEQN